VKIALEGIGDLKALGRMECLQSFINLSGRRLVIKVIHEVINDLNGGPMP
jgi:hypothetical protein